MALEPTPTVRGVIDGLTSRPVVVRDVVEALVKRHPEYGAPDPLHTFAVEWPDDLRSWDEAEDLERDVDALFPDTIPGGELHGRLLLLGAGLLDLDCGRAMVRSGLFQAVARDLDPPLPDVLTAEGRARLRTIPLATVETTTPIVLEQGHGAAVTGIALGRDGHRVVTVDLDGRVAVWNRRARRRIAAIEDDAPTTWTGFVGVGVDDGRAQLVDARSRRRLRLTTDRVVEVARDEVDADVEGTAAVTAAPASGRLAWIGADGGVSVADPADEEPRRLELSRAGSPVQPSTIALAPSGEVLVAGGRSGPVGLFSTTTGALLEELTGAPAGLPTAVAVDGRGGIVIAYDGSLAHRPPPELGLPSSTMPTTTGHDLSGATSLVASPTDALVAGITPSGQVLIVETGEQRVIARLPVRGPVTAIAYSGDGHWLAVAAGTAVHLFAVGTRPTPLPPAPPLYAADDPDARTDLLELDDEIRAFASLVAAVDVAPPLAIGVFGDWGSGKTFFIRRLRREVAELSADARASDAPQRRLGFYKHVVQVEFNAWHYAEGDLLASLVTHLFSNLEQFGDEPPGEVARRRDWVLEQLREERGKQERLEAEAGGLLSEEERLADELDAQRVRHGDEVQLLASEHERLADERRRIAATHRSAVAQVVGAVGIAAPAVGAGVEQLRAALTAADEEARHGAGVLRRPADVTPRQWVARTAAAGALLTGLAMLVAWLLRQDGAAAVVGLLTTAGALVSGAATLIDRATKQAGARRAAIAAVDATIEAEETALRDRHTSERAAIEARLTETRERIERLEAAQAERHRRETELRRTLAAITPSRVLADYVVERAGSDDYRSLLGVHSLVQRDFRTLADLVDRSNRDELRVRATRADGDAGDGRDGRDGDDGQEAEQRRINRIVLYIDDLDRCPPAVVVSVLQAVHLLLAFPLFVVVVAVDPRWVAHALETTYPELLLRTGGEATRPKATAYDYLEKIFQVPFWVRSVPPDGVGSFVAGLTGGAARPVDDTPPPDDGTPADAQDADPDGPPGSGTSTTVGAGEGPAASTSTATTEAPDLSPERLRLSDDELATLEHVAPLLGRSPRRIKRFVNVYRLIRATEDDPDFATARDGHLSASQAVAVLLAIITGMPDSAPGLFDLLRGTDEARSSGVEGHDPDDVDAVDVDGPTLADLVRGIRPLDCRPEDWVALARWLGLRGGATAPWPVPLASLRPWLGTVTRYSFAVPLDA